MFKSTCLFVFYLHLHFILHTSIYIHIHTRAPLLIPKTTLVPTFYASAHTGINTSPHTRSPVAAPPQPLPLPLPPPFPLPSAQNTPNHQDQKRTHKRSAAEATVRRQHPVYPVYPVYPGHEVHEAPPPPGSVDIPLSLETNGSQLPIFIMSYPGLPQRDGEEYAA